MNVTVLSEGNKQTCQSTHIHPNCFRHFWCFVFLSFHFIVQPASEGQYRGFSLAQVSSLVLGKFRENLTLCTHSFLASPSPISIPDRRS